METDINIRKINLVKKVLELKDEFFLEKIEKFKVLQIPSTKSTPKSKIEEYVQRID